ncbi:MAG: XRE family transcriptional regulator [Planktomarina sp.]
MDKFLEDVRNYADACNMLPSTIVQRANAGGGAAWKKWETGKSSPTMRTVDRIRQYMADNPPPAKAEDAA